MSDHGDQSPYQGTPRPITPSMHSGHPGNIAYIYAQRALADANEALQAAMNATHFARVAQRAATRATQHANAIKPHHPGGGGSKRKKKRNCTRRR